MPMGECLSTLSENVDLPNKKTRRKVYQMHKRGLDDFEKIPDLNWEKFDRGVSDREVVLDICPGTSSTGKVYKVTDCGSKGKDFYRR